jgi:hypothetical protein
MKFPIMGILLFLSACSSTSTTTVVATDYSHRTYTNEKPTALDTSLTWYNKQRSGAAINEEGYQHVLGHQNIEILADEPAEPLIPSTPADAAKTVSKKSYSVYEMSRWERFCGAGKMDETDWDFVAKEGRGNVPETLDKKCDYPSFTRQEYLAAWKANCLGETTAIQKVILEKTLKPASTCVD